MNLLFFTYSTYPHRPITKTKIFGRKHNKFNFRVLCYKVYNKDMNKYTIKQNNIYHNYY